MDKQLLFRKSVLAGTVVVSLGLSGCVLPQETYNSEESQPVEARYEESERPETEVQTFSFTQEEVICDVEGASCEPASDYLTTQFVTSSPDKVVVTEDISASRPAGREGIAVKDKKVNALDEKETVWYATTSEPGVSEDVKVEAVTAEDVMAGDVKENIKVEPVEAAVAAALDTTVETVTETRVQVEPGEAPAVEVVPTGMVPLKKVKTTITETTTRYQKSVNDGDPMGMTLAERIAYGEGVHDWDATAGSTLRQLLFDWGFKSGWTVVWKLDRDYHLEAGVIFRGTFKDVSGALVRSFARATPAPIGTFYQGNRVLLISTQEDENER